MPPLIKRPTKKRIAEVTLGILNSGSLPLCDIARSLKEPLSRHHTVKRLSRMLGPHSEVTWACEDLRRRHLGKQMTDDRVIGIDPGDLNHEGSAKNEKLCKVCG